MALFKQIRLMKKPNLSQQLQLRFLEQLAYLLANGYSLIRALDILKWEKTYQLIASPMQQSLKEGKFMDEALVELSFHPSITSYLYFVRLHGDLSDQMESCANMFARKQTYERAFKRTIRYPLFLSAFFFILFIAIKQFILPSFETMLSSQGSSTNIAHTILHYMNISFVIGGILIILIIAFTLVWKWKNKNLSTALRIQLYQKIPFYRAYLKLSTSHQLATHMATLFQSGLTIKEALLYLQQQKKLPIVSHYAAQLQNELHAGIQLADVFDQLYFIEPYFGHIFQKNKDQQAIAKDLSTYATLVTEELHRKSMQVISFIQPLFFVVIALFIISMYIAIMWPMFDMIQNI